MEGGTCRSKISELTWQCYLLAVRIVRLSSQRLLKRRANITTWARACWYRRSALYLSRHALNWTEPRVTEGNIEAVSSDWSHLQTSVLDTSGIPVGKTVYSLRPAISEPSILSVTTTADNTPLPHVMTLKHLTVSNFFFSCLLPLQMNLRETFSP